ncbi:NADH-quinone oxidoreductase subunit NuoH [Saccharothrix coeruleofusca]|uniref:NADH-quinone oxidoreductase subunit H n=1 Tax=Saccharothrix coeruleofusca TaxID=33919 RepID=A0A918AMR1_9PSEU|nr:NADH-quinone oxidoreductase subunit NuoH [Saccharothrix coeruleofusca]MBP2339469.1 NADH-quinone oxidoreductase subunit H [Saccharothrix coeruleofusca]GGP57461.1 NADH-quinone oxidoreductase subunit H [Saccharothrix coeruleofusca]
MSKTAELLADDPLWLIIVKVVGIFAFLVVMTLFMINWERKVVARMQQRPGPNRVGPGGWLQSLADGLKLAFKEDIRPVLADKWVYFLAPVISCVPAFLAFAVIPIGGEVSIFGERTALQLVDLPVGVLVVLACSSVGVYGIVLSGWASGSPYPLLGALRSAAQVISYEIAMGLSIVAVVMNSASLSTADIVEAQAGGWYFYLLPVSFAIYVISMVGETNRAPFDLPEAESELVGGFHTEYSSLKFALFFLAEYINMVTVSALATTLFLGGWRFPFVGDDHLLNSGWFGLLWFVLKTLAFLFLFIWLRGTLPRLRYDQFMRLGWKFLVPIALVWFVAVAFARYVRQEIEAGGLATGTVLAVFGAVLAAVLLIAFLLPDRREERDPNAVPVTGGGFPVPPLDLAVPKAPPRRRDVEVARLPKEPAAVTTGKEAGDGDA